MEGVHRLRHTFGTHAAPLGANPWRLQVFHPLPPPWDDDVAKLLEQIARAIHRLITRYLAARGDDDLLATEQAQTLAGLPARTREPSCPFVV